MSAHTLMAASPAPNVPMNTYCIQKRMALGPVQVSANIHSEN